MFSQSVACLHGTKGQGTIILAKSPGGGWRGCGEPSRPEMERASFSGWPEVQLLHS